MNEKKYRDLFIDFDDTIYDTYGNANMALREVYKELNLGERLNSEEEFYDRYWRTNIELWGQYGASSLWNDSDGLSPRPLRTTGHG